MRSTGAMKIVVVTCLFTVAMAAAASGAATGEAAEVTVGARDKDSARQRAEQEKAEQEEAEQNARAHYSFQAYVDDRVSDLTLQREEARDGLTVTGSFAYSDGFVRRRVKYVADENGYRVLSDEAEPLSGPQGDPEGESSVHTVVEGQELRYSVHNSDRAATPPRPKAS